MLYSMRCVGTKLWSTKTIAYGAMFYDLMDYSDRVLSVKKMQIIVDFALHVTLLTWIYLP